MWSCRNCPVNWGEDWENILQGAFIELNKGEKDEWKLQAFYKALQLIELCNPVDLKVIIKCGMIKQYASEDELNVLKYLARETVENGRTDRYSQMFGFDIARWLVSID